MLRTPPSPLPTDAAVFPSSPPPIPSSSFSTFISFASSEIFKSSSGSSISMSTVSTLTCGDIEFSSSFFTGAAAFARTRSLCSSRARIARVNSRVSSMEKMTFPLPLDTAVSGCPDFTASKIASSPRGWLLLPDNCLSRFKRRAFDSAACKKASSGSSSTSGPFAFWPVLRKAFLVLSFPFCMIAAYFDRLSASASPVAVVEAS
mmetsp:Transcript_18207/g.37633  ORF Transcript_18207/g.37633 Transcript_18207/m.37633 type:complete len:204 (+) Transcript_18207:1951-2562(+)